MEKQKEVRRPGVYAGLGLYLILMLIGLGVYFLVIGRNSRIDKSFTDEMLVKAIKEEQVVGVKITQNAEVPTGVVKVVYNDGKQLTYYTADVNDTIRIVKDNSDKIKFTISDVKRPWIKEKLLPALIIVIILIIAVSIWLSKALDKLAEVQKSNNNVMEFGKSRAKKDIKTGVTFDDVAGLYEEKEELKEVVDFLKNPQKYVDMGAKIPKGVIMVGPPGTGKTLLAKAVSGEANVPFYSISGSEFLEMLVGVGASRVRDLFKQAKKNKPCIIFIDEIDAVARRRGSGLGGGHDEREQTLNQLLVEMDGFDVNEGIIVMAATNRVDILDPAILRPGRFDRKVAVGRPDVKGREDIIRIHIRNKKLGDDVDIKKLAKMTSGFSGADLSNLLNEAAIAAAGENRAYINNNDIENAFIKVGIGTEKKSRVVQEKERKITAYHESGHAILFHELSEMNPVHTVSIIPTGVGAAGYTMPIPSGDNEFGTKKKMTQQIMVSFGGRIAEELVFDDVTTGASQDIREATALARDMVIKYGFSSKVGPINYEVNDEQEVFLGRDLGHVKSYGEEITGKIDAEVEQIIEECYTEAKKIIENNMDVLHASANLLLEKERISGDEFDSLFNMHNENKED